jgi:hypothetical protein
VDAELVRECRALCTDLARRTNTRTVELSLGRLGVDIGYGTILVPVLDEASGDFDWRCWGCIDGCEP